LFIRIWSKEIRERKKVASHAIRYTEAKKWFETPRDIFSFAQEVTLSKQTTQFQSSGMSHKETASEPLFTIEHLMSYNSFDNEAQLKIYPFFFLLIYNKQKKRLNCQCHDHF